MSDEIYYDQNSYNSGEEENPNSGKKGFAVTSLILGIVSLVCCCCGFGYITAPISIIFAIIVLVKKYGGKGMAIAGIIMSAICIILLVFVQVSFGPEYKQFASDYISFAQDADNVIDNYEATGQLPDYLEKYTDSKYDSVWKNAGFDDFYGFFDQIVDQYRSSTNNDSSTSINTDDENAVSLGCIIPVL